MKSWRDVRRSDGLGWQLVRLQEQLVAKEHHCGVLQTLLQARTERIDQLTATIDQLRAANARLDAEAERLCEMVRLSP